MYDLVDRKGPISHRGIMEQVSTYSSDEVFRTLYELVNDGEVGKREGVLKVDGTTEDVYYLEEDRERGR